MKNECFIGKSLISKNLRSKKGNKIITKCISILKKEIENRFVKYEKFFADEILFGGYLTPTLFIKLDLKTKRQKDLLVKFLIKLIQVKTLQIKIYSKKQLLKSTTFTMNY